METSLLGAFPGSELENVLLEAIPLRIKRQDFACMEMHLW